jgi:hypothetical protein
VDHAIAQMLSRTDGDASCTKRSTIFDGRLMKNGSIQ